MKQKANAIAIYSRKSKFTGKGESIGNQIELCKEYIKRNYGETALQSILIYEDEGFSGGNVNRPAFQRMISDAKAHKFTTIVVYRLDRISRNINDFAGLIDELSRLNVSFVSVSEQFDTDSPMGRAMMYIASVFSQLERETIAERIRDNMHELAKTGRWLGGVTPTGYQSESVQSVTVDGKQKKAYKLTQIPEEVQIVQQIFSLFLETKSLTQIEAELMKRGILTKQGKSFTRFSIKNILQNPVYVIADEEAYCYFMKHHAELFSPREAFDGTHGLLAYNRTDQEKGRSTIYLPIQEWILAVGQHQGIISGKQWIAVQELLEQNKSKAFRRPRSNEALLTGLLYCRCGCRMYPKLTKRKTPDGALCYSYVCKQKERSQRVLCDSKNVNGNLLDKAIIEQIKSLEEDKSTFVQQLEASRAFYTGNRMEYGDRLADLKQQKERAEQKMTALVDTLTEADSTAVRNAIKKRIDEYQQTCDSLEANIRELEALNSQHVLSDIEFDILRQMLSTFASTIDTMTVEQKRTAIRTLVKKVVWDGTNVYVLLFGAEEETDVPDVDERELSDSVENALWCEDSE